MKYDAGPGIALKTATTGICDLVAADTKVPKKMRDFATEYAAILNGSNNTSYDQDMRMKHVLDTWWLANIKIQKGKI